MRTAVRETSIAAYYAFVDGSKRDTQHAIVIKALVGERNGLTRAELTRRTGLAINVITPRVHELLHPTAGAAKLEELPVRVCTITGGKASPVRLLGAQASLFPEAA